MPGYIRKYARKAKKFFKKRYGGGARGIVRLARDVNMLKTAVNTERKYYHRGDTPLNITYAAPYAFHPFDGLLQGVTEITRTGDQIKALYTSIKLHLENIVAPTADEAAPQSSRMMVRMMVILDTGSRYDAALSASDLRSVMLQTPGDARGSILSGYKTTQVVGYGNPGTRFKVLRDKTVTLDLQNRSQFLYKTNIHWKKSKLKGLRIRYDEYGTSLGQPDPRLYVLLWTDSTVTNLTTRVVTSTQFVDN